MPDVRSTVNSYNGARATDRGTPIMKPGSDMNKDAFLKILAAELANLDPTGENDSTQYVTQMAQFASMEQMSNLNDTMVNFSSNELVGKGVTMRIMDSEGQPYTGVVKSVTVQNGMTSISVEVNEGGKNVYKEFDAKDILTILDVPDYSLPVLNNMNGNMQLLVASSFINKNVELSEKGEDGEYLTGKVLGVIKDDGYVKVRIKLDGSDEIKEYTYDKITKVNGDDVVTDKEETDKEENS